MSSCQICDEECDESCIFRELVNREDEDTVIKLIQFFNRDQVRDSLQQAKRSGVGLVAGIQSLFCEWQFLKKSPAKGPKGELDDLTKKFGEVNQKIGLVGQAVDHVEKRITDVQGKIDKERKIVGVEESRLSELDDFIDTFRSGLVMGEDGGAIRGRRGGFRGRGSPFQEGRGGGGGSIQEGRGGGGGPIQEGIDADGGSEEHLNIVLNDNLDDIGVLYENVGIIGNMTDEEFQNAVLDLSVENLEIGGNNIGGRGNNIGGRGNNIGGRGENIGGRGENIGGRGENIGGRGENIGGRGDNIGGRGDNIGGRGNNIGGRGKNMGTLGELLGIGGRGRGKILGIGGRGRGEVLGIGGEEGGVPLLENPADEGANANNDLSSREENDDPDDSDYVAEVDVPPADNQRIRNVRNAGPPPKLNDYEF